MCDLITMMNLGFHERKSQCLCFVCVKKNSKFGVNMRKERSGSWGGFGFSVCLFLLVGSVVSTVFLLQTKTLSLFFI